jgi:8-oxo-dGTP diphosphatase
MINTELKDKINNLRNITLVFLIKKTDSNISEICLAMKKRGFGVGRWNGVGGKLEPNETIIEAAKREAQEEIAVTIDNLQKVAELDFYFPHNPSWNQKVHVYFVSDWIGEPKESEEMKPAWFLIPNIPYSEMWPDDKFWLPEVLNNNKVKASFTFGEKDIILNQEITLVENI